GMRYQNWNIGGKHAFGRLLYYLSTDRGTKATITKWMDPLLKTILLQRLERVRFLRNTDNINDFRDLLTPPHIGGAIPREIEGRGLNIITDPNQLIARLPVLIGSLEAGNNAKEVKNELFAVLDAL